MSSVTQILVAIITAAGFIAVGVIKLIVSQSRSARANTRNWIEVKEKLGALDTTVGGLGQTVEKFDIVLSGYRGIGGLLLEVERLKERDGTGDQRIRDGAKHAAGNAVTPIVTDLQEIKESVTERLDDHESRLRVLERGKI